MPPLSNSPPRISVSQCTPEMSLPNTVIPAMSPLNQKQGEKQYRRVRLPIEIMEMIQEYKTMLYDYKPSDRLFPTTKSYLTREMVRGCKLSGVKKIRIHDLRHSHASLLIELGFAPVLISERLGHENVETTLNTYSHLYPNKHGEVAEILTEYVL